MPLWPWRQLMNFRGGVAFTKGVPTGKDGIGEQGEDGIVASDARPLQGGKPRIILILKIDMGATGKEFRAAVVAETCGYMKGGAVGELILQED